MKTLKSLVAKIENSINNDFKNELNEVQSAIIGFGCPMVTMFLFYFSN